jgi:hypothetical protein
MWGAENPIPHVTLVKTQQTCIGIYHIYFKKVYKFITFVYQFSDIMMKDI